MPRCHRPGLGRKCYCEVALKKACLKYMFVRREWERRDKRMECMLHAWREVPSLLFSLRLEWENKVLRMAKTGNGGRKTGF